MWSMYSTQVCLALIGCIQRLFEKNYFSVSFLKSAVQHNENCLSTWMFISHRPDSRHALGLLSRRAWGAVDSCSEGKNSDKAAFIHGGRCMGIQHGSLTTGNKDTVCERISKEMPSQPVVPGWEHTAVNHNTTPWSTLASMAQHKRVSFLIGALLLLLSYTAKSFTRHTSKAFFKTAKPVWYSHWIKWLYVMGMDHF